MNKEDVASKKAREIEALRRIRHRVGMTQEQVAEAVGYSEVALGAFEQGQIVDDRAHKEWVERLSEFYFTDPDPPKVFEKTKRKTLMLYYKSSETNYIPMPTKKAPLTPHQTFATEATLATVERPKTRADCKDGCRPCPFVGCRYHLYLDVNEDTGNVILNFPDKEPWELEETCALDVADKANGLGEVYELSLGEVSLEAVGTHMNLTRERIRQVMDVGLGKLREALEEE